VSFPTTAYRHGNALFPCVMHSGPIFHQVVTGTSESTQPRFKTLCLGFQARPVLFLLVQSAIFW